MSLSLVAVAVIAAAYMYMPDFQRGVWLVAGRVAEWWLSL